MMELARATGITLPEATQIASTVMRTFSLNSKQMGSVVDVMTASANTAMQSVTDLGRRSPTPDRSPRRSAWIQGDRQGDFGHGELRDPRCRGNRHAADALAPGNTRVQGLYKELGVEVTDAAEGSGPGKRAGRCRKALAKLPDMQRLNYLTKMFGIYSMAEARS